jgi:hypothetical protein
MGQASVPYLLCFAIHPRRLLNHAQYLASHALLGGTGCADATGLAARFGRA